jgi:hypothetical protein
LEKKPTAEDYPNALPHLLFAGSLVFATPKHSVDLRDWSQWWTQWVAITLARLYRRLLLPTLRRTSQKPWADIAEALRPVLELKPMFCRSSSVAVALGFVISFVAIDVLAMQFL